MIAIRQIDGSMAYFHPNQIERVALVGPGVTVFMNSSFMWNFSKDVWREAVRIFRPLIYDV